MGSIRFFLILLLTVALDLSSPTVARENRAVELHRPLHAAAVARRPAPTTVTVRKLPPSVADSSITPEDH
jgi:hypothetical protein